MIFGVLPIEEQKATLARTLDYWLAFYESERRAGERATEAGKQILRTISGIKLSDKQQGDFWKQLSPRKVLLSREYYMQDRATKRYMLSKISPEFNVAKPEDQEATIDADLNYWKNHFETPDPPSPSPKTTPPEQHIWQEITPRILLLSPEYHSMSAAFRIGAGTKHRSALATTVPDAAARNLLSSSVVCQPGPGLGRFLSSGG